MADEIVPIFRVKDGVKTAAWYSAMGFEIESTHRFAPNLPLYTVLDRKGVHLHLSEHKGDAPKKSLAYLWVDDIEPIATAYGLMIEEAPWALEVTVVDPDGNQLRVGQALSGDDGSSTPA